MARSPKRKPRRYRGGATILCPKCETPSRVYKTSRDSDNVVHRHRYCEKCSNEFFTEERKQK